MSPRLARGMVALGALLVLVMVNLNIFDKERIRRTGERVYLQLAPVDPRSLLQGDYLALRFALVDAIDASDPRAEAPRREGETRFAVVALDGQGVAHLAPPGTPAPLRLRYRIRDGKTWLGTNAFFFREGEAWRFTGARYGEFRVDPASGEALLVALRDGALKPM